MNNYDDLSPTVIRSGLKGTKMPFPNSTGGTRAHLPSRLVPSRMAAGFFCVMALLGLVSLLTKEHSAKLFCLS